MRKKLQISRRWLALAALVVSYFILDPVEKFIYVPIAHAFGLHMVEEGMMGLPPYAVLMMVRLLLEFLIVAGVLKTLGQRLAAFPLIGPGMAKLTALGLGTGLVVMVGAILTIVAMHNATAVWALQSTGSAFAHGLGWLVFDFVGATGEEMFGRVAVLVVAERFVGWRGAIFVSGLMFSVIHLDNPGATWVWLLRLFLQGVVLAYAVYRTGSLWWSVAYHTGWNWASAPLFGAAGSGYLDRGHLFDFTPTGPVWITGGSVGPEGSIFAFAAVFCAFGLLVSSTKNLRSSS